MVDPEVVGVPEISPVLLSKVRPAGSDPVRLKVSGAVPPLVVRVAL